METILRLLPELYSIQLNAELLENVRELRLCVGQPMMVRTVEKELAIWPRLNQAQLEQTLQCACRHSVYAYAETIRQGFVTVEGGHRLGICGFGVMENGQVKTLRTPSSLLIRIARDAPGCGKTLYPNVRTSTILVGPPCSGKTTLLRDLVRQLSDEQYQRVGLADERGELSAMVDGVPQLTVGMRTDVLINLPKAQAVMMLLRTMNPQWIAMDEITDPEDLRTIVHCAYCGVKLLATAHGVSLEDMWRRPLLRTLLQEGVFDTVVELKLDRTFAVREVQR